MPVEGRDIPRLIEKQIKSLVLKGRLLPGDKLPSQRRLVRELQVSRSSLREGLQMLETSGIVKIIPGKGTYIQQPRVSADYLNETILGSWSGSDEEKMVSELFETRRLLEVEAAGMAAQRATARSIEKIQECLDRLTSMVEMRNIEGMAEADIEFHRSIFIAADNGLLLALIDSIAESLRETRKFAFRLSGGLPQTRERHDAILKAIQARDPDRARATMAVHLDESRRFLDLYLAGGIDSESINVIGK
jgi:GntR family transcriptional repressor for pyruvate dehydrogenase complex